MKLQIVAGLVAGGLSLQADAVTIRGFLAPVDDPVEASRLFNGTDEVAAARALARGIRQRAGAAVLFNHTAELDAARAVAKQIVDRATGARAPGAVEVKAKSGAVAAAVASAVAAALAEPVAEARVEAVTAAPTAVTQAAKVLSAGDAPTAATEETAGAAPAAAVVVAPAKAVIPGAAKAAEAAKPVEASSPKAAAATDEAPHLASAADEPPVSTLLVAFLKPETGALPAYDTYMARCVGQIKAIVAAFDAHATEAAVQSRLFSACRAQEPSSTWSGARIYGDCARFATSLAGAREDERQEGGEHSGYPNICVERYDHLAPRDPVEGDAATMEEAVAGDDEEPPAIPLSNNMEDEAQTSEDFDDEVGENRDDSTDGEAGTDDEETMASEDEDGGVDTDEATEDGE